MKIESITIIRKSTGSDHIVLHTDLPEAGYPFSQELSPSFTAARGSGESYCAEYFPDIPVKIVP